MRKEQLEELEAYLSKPGMAEANPGFVSSVNSRHEVIKSVPKVPGENKYHAKRTNGYASKKEAQYAAELELRQKAGEVWFWLEQVKFKLPGNTVHRVDFMVFYCHRITYHIAISGKPWQSWELVEIKGRDLPMGRLKRRQVEEIYHVQVTVI